MISLKFKFKDSTPKYKQIIETVVNAINQNLLKKGDSLPSINSIRDDYKVSRDTVLTAYNYLKSRGIIQSIVGKGYFVASENVEITQKIFVLFDELNSFKEELYHSFKSHLGQNVRVDIYFHHFNRDMFSKLIYENYGNYNYYVIMPANLKDTEQDIKTLPEHQVYILDQTNPSLSSYAGVHQNFEKDIYNNLNLVIQDLIKYSMINLVFSDTIQPLAMRNGFERFCKTHHLNYNIIDQVEAADVVENHLYIIPEDKDLLSIIKIAKQKQFVLQKDYGIISYNDTLLKELVEDGISTISTDFNQMGAALAQMIQNNERISIENPCQLIIRNSF